MKLGVTHDLGWWLIGKPMVDFLFTLIELLFTIYYGYGVTRRNVYSLTIFTGGWRLCAQILLDRSSPINHSWRQKTRDTELPDVEDRIPLHSLVLTQYQSVTDRQTDILPVAYTALGKLALQHAVKRSSQLLSCYVKNWCIGERTSPYFRKEHSTSTLSGWCKAVTVDSLSSTAP